MPQTIAILQPGTKPSAVAISNLGPILLTGSAGTFAVTVTPQNPVPTGIFELTLDGGTPGAPILLKGAVNTLTLPAAGLTVGQHTLSVFYSGDATYNVSTSTTVTYQVPSRCEGQLHALSRKLQPDGQSAEQCKPDADLPPARQRRLHRTGAISCTDLPVNTACVFSPGTVNVTGTGDFTTLLTLVLNTGFKSSSLPVRGLGLAALFGLGLAFRRRRRVVAFCVLACLAAVSGCGGGYAMGDTSAGINMVNVIATSGNVSQTAQITLTVQ